MVRKGFKRADGWLLYNSLNVNKNSLKQQTVYEVVTENETVARTGDRRVF